MTQRHHFLLGVVLGVGLLLAACGPNVPSQSSPPAVVQPTPEPQPPTQPQPTPEPQPQPKPMESSLQRFERENPGVKVLQSVEADLNKDGTEELVVAYQPSGSQGAVVGILTAGGGLLEVDSINMAKAVQPIKILDHGQTVHLVVIMGLGHNYVVSLYTYDGKNLSKFWQIEADESADVQGNELVIKRRLYKRSGPGYDVETAILSWDPTTNEYVIRKG